MRRGRNEGSITQRQDGRWEARIDLGRDPAGRRLRRSVYGRTRDEAHKALQAALRGRDEGRAPTPARLTVGAYLVDTWLPIARVKVRRSTYDSYSTIVAEHLVPAIGQIRLGALSVSDVDRMLRAKETSISRRGRRLSARRVAMVRATLRVALGHAVRTDLVPRNVASLSTAPKQERHEIAPLSTAEVRTFLAAVRGDRLEALWVTAVATGLRQGELLGLRWRDVRLDVGELDVAHALGKFDGRHELVPPKSSSSRRTIALGSLVVDALRSHRTRQLEERLAAGPAWQPTIDDLVFVTAFGTPLDPSNVGRSFHRILTAGGLPRRRFHDLRHSAATVALATGVSPRVVQAMLGHSQISLTLGTYSHVLPELQRDAVDRMDALLSGAAGS